MTPRENALAILRGQPAEALPTVCFGYWSQTLSRWAQQGHITKEDAEGYCAQGDGGEADRRIMARLGFDFVWSPAVTPHTGLLPSFDVRVVEERPDGGRVIRNAEGLLTLVKPGLCSIPAEIGTSLLSRTVWESAYLPRLQFSAARVRYDLSRLPPPQKREAPLGLHCGSLCGYMRNLLGVQQMSYLYADDPELYGEIVDTIAELCYRCTEAELGSGVVFDYAHFWEDICYRNGPLVAPSVFREYFAPHYRRITKLLRDYGVELVSLDCDGKIDALLPIWLENDVQVMFPIEVGTWGGSIGPWRAQYGSSVRGVGGVNKHVFSKDRAAVDAEIDRLTPLIAAGGYLPCPDHRLPPDTDFALVQYFCDRLHRLPPPRPQQA